MQRPWMVIAYVLIGLVVLYLIARRRSSEGFTTAASMAAYADSQATYFNDVVDKGLIVNPGLDSTQINDALYQPDLYMSVSKDRDYSTYFIEDPTLKYMKDDESFCRGARHPRDLKARDPGSRVGCGWYYRSDPSTPSVGALGTREGPLISNNLAGGVWIWNVAEAAKREDIKMCKRVKSCDLMSVEGVKGKCGFCERLGYAVPANADGSDKYPEDADGSCGQTTVMDASSCAKPLPVPLVTSDGIECGNYGRPSADGSKRLYTRAECDALNGIYTPDGKCASRGGGSYSDMCRELNDPAQATPTVCTPNALGNLTRECLKSLALGLGYNKSGAIVRVLETGAAPTETDRNARDVLRGAGIAIPDAVLGAGNIDTTSAGTVYQRIYNAMTGGATSMVREAAKWMVTGSNAFDVCDFGPTARGPFPLTCLQRAFRQAGCQPVGIQHPSEASAQRYASMTWGEVNGEFKQLYADMKSGDSNVQDKALTSCLGLKYAREPPKACPVQRFDYVSQPNEPTLTYNELRDVCQRKGMKVCHSRDLCKDGKPIADLDIFGSADNWIAVSDKENEWFTYNRGGNRLCKTHTEVDGRLPSWGTTKNARGWARAVKCCAQTYTTVKGGYSQTSGLQPSCFLGLSAEQAQEGCNKLGSRCGGFSYSVDGRGHGCYKGDVKGGFVNDPNYMGYVKST